MRALLSGITIADAKKEDLIYIEGNWYFPLNSVRSELLQKSNTPYTCPWKGVCQYYDIKDGDEWKKDNAFSYPKPLKNAIERVKKDFSGYIAFWQDVEVKE